jgi:hypothetical protein
VVPRPLALPLGDAAAVGALGLAAKGVGKRVGDGAAFGAAFAAAPRVGAAVFSLRFLLCVITSSSSLQKIDAVVR